MEISFYLCNKSLPSLTCSKVCWSRLSSSCKKRKEHFTVLKGSPWLTLELLAQPQTVVNQPLNKLAPQVMSMGLIPNLNIKKQLQNTNVFINISNTSLQENIRPTGRAKEESRLSCLRCVAALIREEMVLVRGEGTAAPTFRHFSLFCNQRVFSLIIKRVTG